jgi:hypothetical protein
MLENQRGLGSGHVGIGEEEDVDFSMTASG